MVRHSHHLLAAWYPDQADPTLQRYFDGTRWTHHTQPVRQGRGPGQELAYDLTRDALIALHAQHMRRILRHRLHGHIIRHLKRHACRQVRYVRIQKGHSLILNLIFGIFVLWFNVFYITVSRRHYWHL